MRVLTYHMTIIFTAYAKNHQEVVDNIREMFGIKVTKLKNVFLVFNDVLAK